MTETIRAERSIESAHRTRIVLVDDHAIMRDGLLAILGNQPDLDVVGIAADGKSAIAVVDECLPDVIIMDLGPGRVEHPHAVDLAVDQLRAVIQEHHRPVFVAGAQHADELAPAGAGAIDGYRLSAPFETSARAGVF